MYILIGEGVCFLLLSQLQKDMGTVLSKLTIQIILSGNEDWFIILENYEPIVKTNQVHTIYSLPVLTG